MRTHHLCIRLRQLYTVKLLNYNRRYKKTKYAIVYLLSKSGLFFF